MNIEAVTQIELLKANRNGLYRRGWLSLFANRTALRTNGRITKHPSKQIIHIELKWKPTWSAWKSTWKREPTAVHCLLIRRARFIIHAAFRFIRQNITRPCNLFELFRVAALIRMMHARQLQICLFDSGTAVALGHT